jgi:glyoxylase-like metal-dependent hydrolase (beta-lactamase superfamily II)
MQGVKILDKRPTRRTFLQGSMSGIFALTLPEILQAQPDSQQKLSNRITLLNSGGVNQLALDAGDGIVLVDSGPEASSGLLLNTLDSLNQGSVHTVFNTHWHPEQVGGNALLKDQGARIIAHQKTLQHLSTRYYLPHENRYHEPMAETSWPTDIFHDRGELNTADESIDYGWLVQPHTDGDIYLYFREANVLAAGDAVSPLRDPELDWFGGGWLGGRVNSLDMLVAMTNTDTQIVPAFGPVISHADLIKERDLMQEVYNRVLDMVREGCSASCMLQEGALDGLGRTWQDPDKFLFAAYKGMWAHHYNLAPNIL